MMFANSTDGYREWRAAKLDNYPKSATELVTEIDGLLDMSGSQKEAILASCRRANMAIYSCRDAFVDRKAVRNFAGFFGLTQIDHHLCANDDGVSELAVATDGVRGDYVPYSSRSLSWHTDGYYNDASRRLQAVLLHCAAAAAKEGGTPYLTLKSPTCACVTRIRTTLLLSSIRSVWKFRPTTVRMVKSGLRLLARYSGTTRRAVRYACATAHARKISAGEMMLQRLRHGNACLNCLAMTTALFYASS